MELTKPDGLDKSSPLIERQILRLTEKFMWLAAVGLVALMLVTFVDVIGRYFFSKPLTASNEITELVMVAVIFLAGGYYTLQGRQINIDTVLTLLSRRQRNILSIMTWFLSLIILALMTWQLGIWGWENLHSPEGKVTGTLLLPEAPFMLIAALGTFLVFLASVVLFIQALSRRNEK